MVVKKKTKPTVGIKEIKKDMLKMMDNLDSLEQKITNVAYRLKRLEQRVGMVI
jgi:prefoldin subunit 5